MWITDSDGHPPIHPFGWVPPRARLPLFLTSLAIALAVLAVFTWAVNLTTPQAARGMVSLQLAGTVERARSILRSWHAAGLDKQSGFNQGIDYLFLLGYGVAGAVMSGGLADCFARTRQRNGVLRVACVVMVIAAWMAVLGAALDAIEDAFLFRVMDGHLTAGNVHAATLTAWTKYTVLALALLAFVVALVAVGVGTRRGPSASRASE
jgi:hypothetical protein